MTEKTSSASIAQGYHRQGESAISTTQSADKVLLVGDAFAQHGPRLWQEEARGFRLLRQWGKACTTNALLRTLGWMIVVGGELGGEPFQIESYEARMKILCNPAFTFSTQVKECAPRYR
jgi:hypothetical protein